MQIKKAPVKDLVSPEWNPRQITTEELEKLKTSLEEFGYIEPIIVNDVNNHVVGGNQRLRALIALGYDEVDCVYVHIEDINKEKACNVALNKISGDWDEDKLRVVLEDIELSPIDIKLTGFDELELTELEVKEPITVHEDDFIIEDEEDMEVNVKEGDLFKLGEHYLLCGDSTVEANVKKLMQGAKADMVFTDPPYGMNLDTDWSGAKSKSKFYQEKGCKGQGSTYKKVIGDNDDFTPQLIETVFDNFDYCDEIFLWGADYYAEFLPNKNEGSWIVWDKRSNEDTQEEYVKQTDKMFGSCFELCWSKNKHRREIARVKWAGIYGTETEFDMSRHHPTQKPIKLSEWFILKFSKDYQTIVDLYGGAGSTLLACEQLNRQCYMMELDPYYCQVIINRWEEYTGRKAEKLPL